MKIKAGDTEVKFDVEIGQLSSIFLRLASGDSHAMARVAPQTLAQMHRDTSAVKARPVYYSIDGKTIKFSPAAIEDAEIILRYYPPMEEL